MPDAPTLTRRDGVELARTGSWALSSGQWRAAPEDFAAAVAALKCPAVRRPYIRIGHTDDRLHAADGDPAIGWIEGLRVEAGGNSLVGDYSGIPGWLDDVLASAYPDRSIEGAYNRVCALGHTHPFVLDGVALLGVTRPGVGTLPPIGRLDDVRNMFAPLPVAASANEVRIAASIPGGSVAAADDKGDNRLRNYWVYGEGRTKWKTWTELYEHLKRHVSAERAKRIAAEWFHLRYGYWPGDKKNRDKVAAADGGSMPNPQPSLADRVKDAWNASGAPFSQHVHMVRAGEAIVLDEADRSFWRVPVTVDGDRVQFGERARVMPDFVDFDEERVAASTTFATREESRPGLDSGGVLPSGLTVVQNNTGQDLVLGADLRWRTREGVAATVLDSPSPIESEPPNPIQPVEPAPPASPPDDPGPTEPEPQTPPQPGGVPHSPGAEPEQEVPTDPEGDDPVSTLSTDVRSRLGLAEDADDAAVVAALDALKQKAEQPEPNPEQVAASAAAVAENAELKAEVKVLASRMEQVTAELAATKAKEAATVKASVLDKAQAEGKFAPADRPQWETDYDEAPAAITRVLASIAPGTAVPVVASGYTGTGEEATGESFDDAEYQRLFGEKAGA